MIESRRSAAFEWLFSVYITRLLRRHFHGIHFEGLDVAAARDISHPTIVYANHSNWWDGFVQFHLSRRLWRQDAHLMMDIAQMHRYAFFRRLGVFSVDRKSARGAYRSVQYAVQLLRGTGRVLFLFPQGILRANDHRPIVCETGVARLAAWLPDASLLCMTLRYDWLNDQRADVFVRLSDLESASTWTGDPRDVARRVGERLEQRLDALRIDVITRKLDSFTTVLHGRTSRSDFVNRYHLLRGNA